MANTIIIKAYVNIRDEKIANAILTPGHLVERMSTDKVKKHASAGGSANALFAIEDAYQGKKITEDYASAALVMLWRPVPGEQVNAIAKDTIVIGDFVESGGDGTLRKYVSPASGGIVQESQTIIGVALEAASADDRFVVEIM